MSVLDEYIANEYVKAQIEKAGDEHFTCKAAEESVIRRMLKTQAVAEDVSGMLTGRDFSCVDYGRIFNAIQRVVENGVGVDVVTVEESLRKIFPSNAKRLVDMMVALTKHTEYNADDNRNIADHVKIVKDLARRRNAIKGFEKAMADLNNPRKNIEAALTEIEQAAGGMDVSEAKFESMDSVMLNTFEFIESKEKGEIKSITTGIDNLDRLIGGFFGGELTIVAARPSVGKTAFGLNIAVSAAQKGFQVGFVSCEMSQVGLGQRLYSRLGMIDGMAMRKGKLDPEQWSRMAEAMELANRLPISWMFNSGVVEDVVRLANRKAARGEIDILIVDYLQFMETQKQFKEERLRIGYISHALKQLAKTANIPVIALSQVTREGEGTMPTMKMLRESGNIEQDADGIIFLHRPSNADDKSVDPRDRAYFDGFQAKGLTYLCLAVAKQRNGEVGQACVIFNPAYMLYSAIDRSDSSA